MTGAVRGRVESALDRQLAGRDDVGDAERAHLRVTARGLDTAERAGDLMALNALSKTYLDLRVAAGLTAQAAAARRDLSGWDDLAVALTQMGDAAQP